MIKVIKITVQELILGLDPSICAHVKVDVAAAVQETFTFTQASFEVDYQNRYSQLQL